MTKTELHPLVDALPDESLEAAAIQLRRAQDPVLAALDAAPLDDEPETEEEREAVAEGYEALRRGDTASLDEINAKERLSGWKVELTGPARRDLRRLDPQIERRVRAALTRLQEGPLHGDIRKLTGSGDEWRPRVGEWRVRFTRDTERTVIAVLRILPRGRAYR